MTRRSGIIRTLVAAMAVLGGRQVYAQAERKKELSEPTFTNGLSGVEIQQPLRFVLQLSLDNSLGINVELKGEKIHITPEEIMEALRAK